MNNLVNFDFIAELEGGLILDGYVPGPDGGDIESGVTIATGFDLGQFSANEIERMFKDEVMLAPILADYAGITGFDAQRIIKRHPLHVTKDEAIIIESIVKGQAVSKLESAYNKKAEVKFKYLPEPVRTVAASVAFQYGSLSNPCPNFWRQLLARDYDAMYHNLVDFGDNYPTRRNKEADYLNKIFNY